MKTVTIDLSVCKTYADIHLLLKRELDFPAYYGENLDALWDCLTRFIERPVTVVFRGMDRMPARLRKDMEEKFLPVFYQAEREGRRVYVVVE